MRIAAMVIALVVRTACAQEEPHIAHVNGAESAPGEAEENAESKWEFSLSAFTYIVPDDSDYVQPTFTADYDWLHLEARYNYEDIDTASVWVGYNFSFGEELTLDFTPMIGGVFGDTRGVAPGYEITLAWRNLELYTEGEFVFDADDSSEDFFYSWSELTYAPTDWLRLGAAAQRTKIRAEDSDIQVGPMIGLTYDWLDLSAYVLFADEGDPTVVLGVSLEF